MKHRPNDVVVAGATADVAFQAFAHGTLIGGLAALDEVDRTHDHPGGAETALQGVAFAESLLHRMQGIGGSDALDGGDRGAVDLTGQHRTRFHGTSIQMDRARPALAGITTHVGTGQAQ